MRKQIIHDSLELTSINIYVSKYDFHIEGIPQINLYHTDSGIHWICVLDDGRIVCKTNAPGLKIFDGPECTVVEKDLLFKYMSVLSDGRIIGFCDKSMYIWNNNLHNRVYVCIDTIPDTVYIRPNDNIVTSVGYAIQEWDLEGTLIFEHKTTNMTCMVPFQTDKLLIGLTNGDIHIVDCDKQSILNEHEFAVLDITVINNETFISTSEDGTSIIWDSKGIVKGIIPQTGKKILTVKNTIIIHMPYQIQIYTVLGEHVLTLEVECAHIALLPNDTLITLSHSNLFQIWDIYSGILIKRWASIFNSYHQIVVSEGKVISIYGGKITVWQ